MKTNLKTPKNHLAISAGNLFTRETGINHIANELVASVGELHCTELLFPHLWFTDALCSWGRVMDLN